MKIHEGMNHLIIKVYEIAGADTLRHRETAKLILAELSEISSSEEVILDFSSIVFASRSFCHELRRNLKDRKVVFINMLEEVEEMMQLASIIPRFNIKKILDVKRLKLVTA